MPRAKDWQTKGGFVREDSDDELGYDDHPWRWIYQDGEDGVQIEQAEQMITATPSRKRKASSMSGSKVTIIGAKMGMFEVRIGDAVLLKSPEAGKDWAGLICAFSDTNEDGDDEMCAYIMWFCSREELENSGSGTNSATTKKARKLPDALSNETYITADFNMNPLTAINGKAIVMGFGEFMAKYPQGKPPKKGKAAIARFTKTIVCRKGVKQRNLRFTDDFEWGDMYKSAPDLLHLIDWVKENTKAVRRRNDDGEYSMQQDETLENKPPRKNTLTEPQTPKKKRKTTTLASTTVTPKSSVKSTKFVTPTSKRIIIKKPLEITPLGTRFLSPSHHLTNSPYSQARSSLHVSAVPLSLPCRSNEFETVYSHLHSAITDGAGSCIYISGTPGTGKTATVREVVASLLSAVQDDELDDFNFVEINGMKVTEPIQSYSLLWEALKGDRVSPANALTLLEHEFSHPSPRRIPCVVLMDELDQLVTKNQSVMYNFFNWPSLRHSRLIVLAVANTMDLPERTLSNKISSRLGLIRITFPGYTHSQLMEIISSRLENVQGLVDTDAVQFAARKVAAVSGDARRALDICRRAVEIAEQQAKVQTQNSLKQIRKDEQDIDSHNDNVAMIKPLHLDTSATSTTTTINPSQLLLNADTKPRAHVTIATIKAAINEATSNPISQHLRSVSLSSKLFLAAILARSRRTGLGESTMGDVLTEAKRIIDVDERSIIKDFLLFNPFTHDDILQRHHDQPSDHRQQQQKQSNSLRLQPGKSNQNRETNMPRILAMGAAAMELAEAGIVTVDQRNRGERSAKVRLRIGEEVVVAAMLGDEDVRGWGFVSS